MQEILFNAIPYAVIVAAVWPLKLLLDKLNPSEKKHALVAFGPWLKKYYWIILILVGAIVATGAIYFYLYEIALIVNDLVNHLETQLQDPDSPAEDLRHVGTTVALLLGAMAAAATLIFQLVRIFTTERQTVAIETGLTTDRINKAVEGLGTEKSVTRQRRNKNGDLLYEDQENITPKELDFKKPVFETITAPNIEVRIGAIYALERIAQEELSFHIQIMEILCAYIRHNAPASLAPDGLEILTLPRDDIQAAITAIGRRNGDQIAKERAAKTPDGRGYRLNLQHSGLHSLNMFKLNFSRALFQGAKLQNSNLTGAELQGAGLRMAELYGTIIDENTTLAPTTLKGAGLWRVDVSNIENPGLLADSYGDASVTLPDGYVAGKGELAHWSAGKLEYPDFITQWNLTFADQYLPGYSLTRTPTPP